MSKIRNFTATVFSGVAGFLIRVEGEVNCGMLTVEPVLNESDPQGSNPTILLLTAYPAVDQTPESFRQAEFTKNIDSEDQYKEVQILDPQGNSLETLPVKNGNGGSGGTGKGY